MYKLIHFSLPLSPAIHRMSLDFSSVQIDYWLHQSEIHF